MILNCEVCGTAFSREQSRGWYLRFPVCSKLCLKTYITTRPTPPPSLRETDISRLYLNNTSQKQFRSAMEKIVAEGLESFGIAYEYEKYIISIFEKKTRRIIYLPDFYLPEYGIFIEVKGRWEHGAYKKVKMCSEIYPLYLFVKDDIPLLRGDTWKKKS